MDAVEQVINAAQSRNKLRFANAGSVDLDRLADQFDESPAVIRRKRNGGGNERTAAAVVADNESEIRSALTTVRNDPSLGRHVVPEQLVKAVMFVENNYNAGTGPLWGIFDRTALPMNLNFNVWRDAFDDYNRAHPNAPISETGVRNNPQINVLAATMILSTITESGVRNNPQMNVLAGTMILSTINAAIDPAITGNQRWALVASIYGHTEATLQAGRPIMYGGKVVEVMEERYPLPARRAEINTNQHAGMSGANLMNLRPLGPDTSASTTHPATAR